MATTQNTYTGDGSTTNYSFTFEYIKQADVKVTLDTVTTTAYTFANATTLSFTTAPTSGAAIRIYRDTDIDTLNATFFPGSAIKAEDLNLNFTQSFYVTQESERDVGISDTTANTAKATADTALTNSTAAVSTANTANTNASAAVSTANTASTNASAAVSTANSASTAAGNAVTTANTASTAATNAVNTANATAAAQATLEANVYDSTELDGGQLDNRYYTETELDAGQLDNRYYTETEADARFWNLNSAENIGSGDTWSASDAYIATTAAIDARIIDLVDDVGGFVPIANETSFPNANPDINNDAGTLISVPLANNLTSDSSGVITISNGTVGNSTVTINGAEASATYAQGFGILVETTSTLNTYTFHRYVPKATEVTTVASNITPITTVSNNISNVNTVAGISSNVTTVAGISGNVTSVANDATDIGTVSTNIANVNTVAGISSNVTTVAN
ncbi:MAG: hypothetical protein CMJ25_04720, partial [Phycisphaerae bacterium]|nr:hypothetical protein [Phycisphaerae bacterium]